LLTDQDPPDVEIVVLGRQPAGDTPIHDRWILCGTQGLRLGTSIGSLGFGKVSEISEMTPEQVWNARLEVDKYATGAVREFEGERIRRHVFPLV
jgi:hypothetical protein